MLTIDRLIIRLPSEFGPRARRIAALVAEGLEEVNGRDLLRIDQVVLPPIEVSPGMSDARIAGWIADAILDRIESAG